MFTLFGWFAIFTISYLSKMLICPLVSTRDIKINFSFSDLVTAVSSGCLPSAASPGAELCRGVPEDPAAARSSVQAPLSYVQLTLIPLPSLENPSAVLRLCASDAELQRRTWWGAVSWEVLPIVSLLCV